MNENEAERRNGAKKNRKRKWKSGKRVRSIKAESAT